MFFIDSLSQHPFVKEAAVTRRLDASSFTIPFKKQFCLKVKFLPISFTQSISMSDLFRATWTSLRVIRMKNNTETIINFKDSVSLEKKFDPINNSLWI